MSIPVLATKLYVPPPRPRVVLRPRLIERLNEGLRAGRKLTLISAPAGFGKTALLSEWVSAGGRLEPKIRAAWLSLDEGDNDPARFLTYLIVTLQTIDTSIGKGMLGVIESPQAPAAESILTAVLNEIAGLPVQFSLILDDYHVIDSQPVQEALTFLLKHLPAQMHLVIATREDPALPLARLRARDQLTELRASDLRFNSAEAVEFLNQAMGLNLLSETIAALETRTEGWIAGLQLAAVALQGPGSTLGHQDPAGFVQSFTGSHRFVLDYLVEEVLNQQPENIQTFLLRTSVLDRLCGPLCEAVLLSPSAAGQATLEYIEQVNLFIIPLDNERPWYRYHHLFADLLRQRLKRSLSASTEEADSQLKELHRRASVWYEDNGLEIEALQHAAAAGEVGRAERLIDGKGAPLYYRGAVAVVLNWLKSLPTAVLDASPSLLMTYASALMVTGQTAGIEQRLHAAEAALHGAPADDHTRDLLGQVAGTRATLALADYRIDTMLAESRRALEYLRPDNLAARTGAIWKLGVANMFQGNRAAASQAYSEAISLSQASGNIFTHLLATASLGYVQETENQLYRAAETYGRVLQSAGDSPQPVASEAWLGLARVLYEWNDLAAAEQHGRQSLHLARQYDRAIDRFIICQVFLARLKLAQGDAAGAAAVLAQADQAVRQHNFVQRLPEVAAMQVRMLLRQGDLPAAAHLALKHRLPLSQARVYLAQGDPSAALALLEPWRRQMEARLWQDERLKVVILQAVALREHGDKDKALQLLGKALALAEPGGFIRIFVDEGTGMAQLLSEAAAHRLMPDYVGKLLAAFEAEPPAGAATRQSGPGTSQDRSQRASAQLLGEPLSQRELVVLRMMAQGLSNHEIGERLFLALNTVKGHNRNIFGKLQVHRRTEAVARARELGLL